MGIGPSSISGPPTSPGSVKLPEGTQMVMPGDNTPMTVELINPIAMDEGLRFAIREGGRTVGAGRVIKINEIGSTSSPNPVQTSTTRRNEVS